MEELFHKIWEEKRGIDLKYWYHFKGTVIGTGIVIFLTIPSPNQWRDVKARGLLMCRRLELGVQWRTGTSPATSTTLLGLCKIVKIRSTYQAKLYVSSLSCTLLRFKSAIIKHDIISVSHQLTRLWRLTMD